MLCNKCHKEKKVTDFSFKNYKKGTRKKICKICHSLYRRKHYLQNKEKYILKAQKWNNNQKKVLANYLSDILSKSKCIDCGEKDIVVLEFDHLNSKSFGTAIL